MPYMYVAPNGSDGNNGSSFALPKLTLQAAINAAGDGDTIRMKAGTYTTAGVTTIDGKSLEIIVYSPSKKWSKGILDGPGSGNLLLITNLGSGQWVKLIGLKFKDAATGVAVTSQDADSTITAFGCWFDSDLTTGYSGGAGTALCHSCTFNGLTTAWSAAANTDIYGSTFYNCTTGISVSGSGAATWKNNIFDGTRTTDVSLGASVTADSDYNGYAGTPSTSVVTKGASDYAALSNWQGTGEDANGVDPSSADFASTSPLDAHLAWTSPLKEIGTNIFSSAAQYGDGTFRPEAGNDSMGAWTVDTGVGSFHRIKDARTLYVRTTGNDTTGNGTSTAPYKTIQHAVDTLKGHAINAIVTIDIGVGTFTEGVVIDDELVISGVVGPAIVLQGDSYSTTIIDGVTNDRVLRITGNVFVQLKDFTLGPYASSSTRYLEIGGKSKVEIVSGSTVVIDHNTSGGEGVMVVSGMLAVSGQLTVDGTSAALKATYNGIMSIASGGRVDVEGADSKALHLDLSALCEIFGTLDVGTSVRGIVVERAANLVVQSGATITTRTSGPAIDMDMNGTATFADGLSGTITAGSEGAVVTNGSTLKVGGTLYLTKTAQASYSAVRVSDGGTFLCWKLSTAYFNTVATVERNSNMTVDNADFSLPIEVTTLPVTTEPWLIVAAGTWAIDVDEGSYANIKALTDDVSGWTNYMRARRGSRAILTAGSNTVTQEAASDMYRAEKMSSILIDGGTHDCFDASSEHVNTTEFGLMNMANSPTWKTAGGGAGTFRTNVGAAGTFDTGAPDGGLAFDS